MGQFFTDEMKVTIKIDEAGPYQKRRAFAHKLRELSEMIESGDPKALESTGASNNDAGFASYRIQSLHESDSADQCQCVVEGDYRDARRCPVHRKSDDDLDEVYWAVKPKC